MPFGLNFLPYKAFCIIGIVETKSSVQVNVVPDVTSETPLKSTFEKAHRESVSLQEQTQELQLILLPKMSPIRNNSLHEKTISTA